MLRPFLICKRRDSEHAPVVELVKKTTGYFNVVRLVRLPRP